MLIGEWADVFVGDGSSVYIAIPLLVSGRVSVGASASLSVSAGGSASATANITLIYSDSVCSFEKYDETEVASFYFDANSYLAGIGTFLVHSVVRPPDSVRSDIRVERDGAVLSVSNTASLFANLHSVHISTLGTVVVTSGSSCILAEVNIFDGGILTVNGLVTIENYMNITNGTVSGSGTLLNTHYSTVFVSPLSNIPAIFISEIDVVNNGTMIISSNDESLDFDITWERGGTLSNFGTLELGNSQTWRHGDYLSSFDFYRSSMIKGASGVWTELNVTVAECAELCVTKNISITSGKNFNQLQTDY